MDTIIQLHPDREGHWALFEKFERRCTDFGKRSGWPINSELRKEIRQRFVATPLFAGYFMTSDLSAHLLSWVVMVYGQPGITIYQCEVEAGHLAFLFQEFFEGVLPAWIQEIENAIKRPVEFIEVNMDTERETPWIDLLRGYRHVVARRTMTVVDFQPSRELGRGVNGVQQ
jgi:hypothetical protein